MGKGGQGRGRQAPIPSAKTWAQCPKKTCDGWRYHGSMGDETCCVRCHTRYATADLQAEVAYLENVQEEGGFVVRNKSTGAFRHFKGYQTYFMNQSSAAAKISHSAAGDQDNADHNSEQRLTTAVSLLC